MINRNTSTVAVTRRRGLAHARLARLHGRGRFGRSRWRRGDCLHPDARGLVGDGARPPADVLDAKQDDRDVVAAAAGVGGVDELARRGAQVGRAAHDLPDVLLGEHHQPVAADQVDVAVAGGPGVVVDLDVAFGPERSGDDRALRVAARLLLRDLALALELGDERVVLGQALELAVAQPVHPRVAHVGDRDVALRQVRGGHRGAHPGALTVGLRHLDDPLVGDVHQAGEPLLRAAGPVGQAVLERLDRSARRDLARLRPAHPVRDCEQRRAREVRVLVALALAAGVGALCVFGNSQHQLVT
jgi:hypothetical protein